MKAKIFLDFDGVVNAKQPLFDDVETFMIPIEGSHLLAAETVITFSPTVVQRLDDFRSKYDVELVWLTTWNESEHILKVSTHLNGLHGGRVLHPPVLPEGKVSRKEWTNWKFEAVKADHSVNPVPFVWVDDHAIEHYGIEVAQTVPVDKFYITPVSLHGLTEYNLEDIELFLNR